MTATITAKKAASRLDSGAEAALIDLREAGQFGEGHPLFAVPLPYSLLEARIGALVPRRDAPVMLIDGGDGIAARAASRLAALGFSDVSVVEGGTPGWAAAGLTLYKGVNVPSKVLGELVEAVWHPPMVTAPELARWQAEGKAMAFFDVRPPAEYARFTVPGATCLPNGELVHRLPAAVPEGLPVVLTCAGRTRGIIGAVSLRLAGHKGELHALENGTQGWNLAGLEVARQNTPQPLPQPDAATLADAASRAEAICAAAGVAIVDASAAAAMAAEPGRTSYLLDIRSAEEAAADPVPAARHALSGQLVQATDQWVAVRGARLLLLDDAGLRGAVAAFWLKQMGFEPVVVRLGPPEGCKLRALPAAPGDVPAPRGAVSPQTALGMVRRGEAEFVDLRPSMTYRKGHVAGAVWCIRPRLAALAAKMGERRILLIADDAAVLALAQQELAGSGHEALPVTGGHEALAAAGAAVEATPRHPADQDCLDYLFFTHDRHDGNMDAARGYLSWEIELVDQLSPAERATFRLMDESVFSGGA